MCVYVVGCDVITKLLDCTFEASHSLADYSLYIYYLWSALTISADSSAITSASTTDMSTSLQREEHNDDLPVNAADSGDHNVETTPQTLTSVVQTHMYQLAFSMCHSLCLTWLDAGSMKVFKNHLEEIEKGEITTALNMVRYIYIYDCIEYGKIHIYI